MRNVTRMIVHAKCTLGDSAKNDDPPNKHSRWEITNISDSPHDKLDSATTLIAQYKVRRYRQSVPIQQPNSSACPVFPGHRSTIYAPLPIAQMRMVTITDSPRVQLLVGPLSHPFAAE